MHKHQLGTRSTTTQESKASSKTTSSFNILMMESRNHHLFRVDYWHGPKLQLSISKCPRQKKKKNWIQGFEEVEIWQ